MADLKLPKLNKKNKPKPINKIIAKNINITRTHTNPRNNIFKKYCFSVAQLQLFLFKSSIYVKNAYR